MRFTRTLVRRLFLFHTSSKRVAKSTTVCQVCPRTLSGARRASFLSALTDTQKKISRIPTLSAVQIARVFAVSQPLLRNRLKSYVDTEYQRGCLLTVSHLRDELLSLSAASAAAYRPSVSAKGPTKQNSVTTDQMPATFSNITFSPSSICSSSKVSKVNERSGFLHGCHRKI